MRTHTSITCVLLTNPTLHDEPSSGMVCVSVYVSNQNNKTNRSKFSEYANEVIRIIGVEYWYFFILRNFLRFIYIIVKADILISLTIDERTSPEKYGNPLKRLRLIFCMPNLKKL